MKISRHSFTYPLFPDKGKAYEKWTAFAEGTSFTVKVDSTIEKAKLPDGSDVADLVISIKRLEYDNSPIGITAQLVKINPVLSKLIETFDLVLK